MENFNLATDMISEECDLDRFIDAIEDLTYHDVLTLTLKEGYAADDLIVHRRRGGASEEELERISEYNRALRGFVFLLQVGERPDLSTEGDQEKYQKFRRVAKSLVERGELLPAILNYFDD
ncbi:MAG: hypothetical protein APR56_03870 [Methanosaeta sp. SDB]|uniref:Uncharacterized protein n=1 Tax=Methanothrix harundinacea TaxID=301375 RepID=A0A101FU02_9EURY|nr:MAG: hypothetical protein APR56_03870 [Methanosaeta sp. SDB]KUK44476.1 MAG: Uncharacterized protein XD72_1143 [Methanothrix harundinacea]KUK95759.1 MAG: Uncharacterized protein XE07_1609 [Methanothrix harundinacea]